MTLQEKIEATAKVVRIIYNSVKQAGPLGIPNGHVYTACMEYMSLESYQGIIEVLIDGGKIENVNDCLIAV